MGATALSAVSQPAELPRAGLLGVSLLQGIALYLLYRSEEHDLWPSASPLWAFPLWTLALLAPLLLLLTVTRQNLRRAAMMTAGFAVILGLLATYIGWQAEPHGEFRTGSLIFTFSASIALATFKALMYLQQRADREPLTYAVLFTHSWRNFLVGVLGAIFTGIFWLILLLWGALFAVIEIDFFKELFEEPWFIIPVLAVAFGIGALLFRELTSIIDSITRILHRLIKLLLPLVALVSTIFVAALPFTGVQPLWDTGNGTALLLWLLAATLFFVNAVYQDGRESDPYPVVLHRAIYIALCVTPLVAGLAFYGLWLRIVQYGLTVERCWGLVTWLVLALFAVGYVVGILRRRDDWTHDLAQVNRAMGLVVLAIMLAANSPLLDFRKLSLSSQLDRVDNGDIELADFDFWYALQHLGRPGYLAVEAMKTDVGDGDPELLALMENPQPSWNQRAPTPVPWDELQYWPEPFDLDDDLRALIEAEYVNYFGDATPTLLQQDLNADGNDEVFLLFRNGSYNSAAGFFYRDAGSWKKGKLQQNYDVYDSGQTAFDNIRVIENPFNDLAIGPLRLHPAPE